MSIVHLNSSGTQAGAIQDGPGIAISHTIDAQANSFAVTAVVTAAGDLRLIAWKLPGDGKRITRVGDSSAWPAEQVSLVSIAKTTQHNFITGVRTASGNLKLIAWRLDLVTGTIGRHSDSGDQGAVSLISATPSPLGDGRALVATRNGAGNLVLQNWMLNSNLHPVKVAEITAGAISRVALGPVGKRAFTAVRDSTGNLKIIIWDVLATGVLKRLGDSGHQGDAISLVDAVSLGSLIVTSVRDSDGNFKIISWKVSADGLTVTKKGDSGAGGADRVASVALPVDNIFSDEGGRVFTTVRTLSKTLKVIAWKIGEFGAITRVEDFGDMPGTVDAIAFESVTGTFVSAVRDPDQRLRLDTWRLDTGTPPQGLADNLVISTNSSWENTAQVFAPPTVSKGRIVLVRGDEPLGYVTRDLLDAGGSAFALTAPEQGGSFMVSSALQGVSRLTSDNQVIRLQDGTLMTGRNAHIWCDLQPAPAWFNTVTFDHPEETAQQRNAVIVFVSNDHGLTWTQRSQIDSAVAANGDFGWPQWVPKNGNYHSGGFDRTELYQDPWTKNIFITGKGDGGLYNENGFNVSNHAGVVFLSKDNGVTWQELHRLPGMASPYVMTSTPDHPLVLLTRDGQLPRLFWLEKGGSSLSGGDSVAVSENGNVVEVQGDQGIGIIRKVPQCIARVYSGSGGRDYVWIAYPTLNEHGRQVYKLCVAGFGGGEATSSELVTTIESVDPSGRLVCMGAFVQDDRYQTALSNSDNLTLFYWVDAPPESAADPNGLFVRFKILFGSRGHFQSGYLSVANGTKRTFNRLGIGDYFKGAYFEWNDKIHFLTQWREPTGVIGNVVSMAP